MYKTKDFEQIVLLSYFNLELKNYEKIGREVWFTFSNENDCKKLMIDYFNGKLEVNPKEFINVYNRMKGVVIGM